jgi:two-component system CheB/CheR fusion protein
MSMLENSRSEPEDLVVVGSSAGGIEALSVLVGTLPVGFPAPVVLAQHLDPKRPSNLALILERRASLPIVVVSEHTPLEAGKIYVVPANRHVRIRDGHVELEADHGDRPRPSVDLLLSSAASVYGERLIAVILTGSGSDGAAGAVEVKNAGGTVIIQNPQTAHYPSMPLALPPTGVDHIAELAQIGPLLYDILKGVTLPEPEERAEDALRDILNQVSRQTNIDFRPYKPSTIMRRIARRMAVTHNHTIRDYEQYLESHPEEVGELVMAFLIKVTEFFRDGGAFNYLRDQVLPQLIERGRANGRVLRCWSAGCATGEEPYSLALLIADQLGAELPEWSVKIFATDLDEGAIGYARRGVYPRNVLNNSPEEYRTRFFEPIDQGFRISKALRQMVIFGQQDLSRGAPFPRIDLVVCRNLLIYFKPELQQRVLDLFTYSLHQVNGYLLLGKAETARPSKAKFEMIDKRWKVYRCISGPIALTSPQASAQMNSAVERGGGRRTQVEKQLDQELPAGQLATGPLRWFNEQVLRFLPLGVAVIDRGYRIVTINGVARRLLSIRDGGHDQDFLHAVRGLPYTTVRNAIDTVLRERTSMSLSDLELDPSAGGSGRYLMLTIAMLQGEAGTGDLVLISINDVTDQVQTRRHLEAVQAEQKQLVDELSAANRRLSDINQDLQDANEELQATNEELTLAQEELQATNEEFEATNEELQATNEELETNNEELQATNEELETNNEELQATNEELETTNDELSARTGELQELARMLESERVRLSEIVELAPFSILVLRGRALEVEAFNQRYVRLFENRMVHGRSVEEVVELFWKAGTEVVDIIRAVYQEDTPRTTQRMVALLPDEHGQLIEGYVVYTIIPTHDADGKVDGVVLYAEDVTAQRAREAEQRREQLQLVFDNAEQVALALYDASSAGLVMASRRYLDLVERTHGIAPDAASDRRWHDLTFVAEGAEAEQIWNTALESRSVFHLSEVRRKLERDQGESVWDWHLTPIMDADQPRIVRYMLVSAIEITEQAQARAEIERLDQLKDEFLSLASHELRTPLTTMKGYAQLLERLISSSSSAPDREQRIARLAAQFNGKVNRLQRLVEDLVDVGRLQSGKLALILEPVDLADMLRQAVEDAGMLSGEHTIELHLPRSGAPLVAEGDQMRLMQVVLNLIQNALTHAAQSKRVDVRLSRAGGRARIQVQDYGPGIAPDAQGQLFRRFYQGRFPEPSRSGGLGLGLFIARQIVEQHGGTIGVQSALGEGTTFIVELPLSR